MAKIVSQRKRENFHFIIFENLVSSANEEISQLENFLKIDLKGSESEKTNSQTESGIDSETYKWLWNKYEYDIQKLNKELQLPIDKWYS